MKYLIFMSVVLVVTAVAHAEFYEWTDKSGVVNFTDNMDKIPPAYRDKAREIDVSPSIQNSEEAAEPANPAVPGAASSYGGHDEFWWRSSYKSLRSEINSIQDSLPKKREKLMELNRLRTLFTRSRDRVSFNDLNDEIKRDEGKVIDLEKRLEKLDDDAARAGVPLEWRN